MKSESGGSAPAAPTTADAEQMIADLAACLGSYVWNYALSEPQRDALRGICRENFALRASLVEAGRAINAACEIIELGDQRLLASDGPAGNQPPDLSLTEWRNLYLTLDKVRQ